MQYMLSMECFCTVIVRWLGYKNDILRVFLLGVLFSEALLDRELTCSVHH
jgi:hypothetical protein